MAHCKLVKKIAGVLALTTAVSALMANVSIGVGAASDVIVDWNDVRQEIDGFGASQACDVYGDQIFNFAKRDEVMDLLFSQDNGIGLSILRCEVGNGLNMPTIEPQDGVWNFAGAESELWVMNEAKARGIDKIFSTVWSPPAWMKTTGKITNGGYLKADCYQKYAEYLAEYVNGYKANHNIDIYAVSIANEPEYAASWQSCLWKPAMFTNFLANYLTPEFAAKNVPAKVIVGEKGWWQEDMVTDALNNPQACARLDIVGGHQYNGAIVPFTVSQSKNKHVWETEVSDTGIYKNHIKDGVGWAKRIHAFMADAEINAFMYWLGASYKTNNESLIRLYNDGSYVPAKRLYTMGNFSKFVKPGYVRIGATANPEKGIYISAYKNPNTGEFSIVAINDSDSNKVINLVPNGFSTGTLTPNVTNEKVNLEQYEDIALKNGKFTVSLGGYSVTTFTGMEGSAPNEEKQWTVVDELNDWTKIYSSSPSWMLEGNNPYGAFDEDPSRARRTSLSKQEIVYKYDNIIDFEADIYFHLGLQGLKFYTSQDGEAWTELQYNTTKFLTTGGGWEKFKALPAGAMPANTNYFKVEFDLGGKEWDKHLAAIRFMTGEVNAAPYDTLDDWSKVYEHSKNWMLDADNAVSFEGDTARARRTTGTTEYITYAAEQGKAISNFKAKLFYFRSHSDTMSFYSSEDGQQWTAIDVKYTGKVDTGGYWNRMYGVPASKLQNCKYLKIEFSGGGLYPWDKQLAEIAIDFI
ncbi:glycoside hydrolase [Hydrogenoanaerobacterium sp.]|uniref:glycoside hydrolase family 30 protein n=1 Tax=Hydrogenoanaerobacterium sp. TaxID=2953763 RepID=UPI0028A1330C|nr:glycoside hydrolase [Hydrogenoanaerobacterium sp.]